MAIAAEYGPQLVDTVTPPNPEFGRFFGAMKATLQDAAEKVVPTYQRVKEVVAQEAFSFYEFGIKAPVHISRYVALQGRHAIDRVTTGTSEITHEERMLNIQLATMAAPYVIAAGLSVAHNLPHLADMVGDQFSHAMHNLIPNGHEPGRGGLPSGLFQEGPSCEYVIDTNGPEKSLWAIGQKFGVSWQQIADANGITYNGDTVTGGFVNGKCLDIPGDFPIVNGQTVPVATADITATLVPGGQTLPVVPAGGDWCAATDAYVIDANRAVAAASEVNDNYDTLGGIVYDAFQRSGPGFYDVFNANAGNDTVGFITGGSQGLDPNTLYDGGCIVLPGYDARQLELLAQEAAKNAGNNMNETEVGSSAKYLLYALLAAGSIIGGPIGFNFLYQKYIANSGNDQILQEEEIDEPEATGPLRDETFVPKPHALPINQFRRRIQPEQVAPHTQQWSRERVTFETSRTPGKGYWAGKEYDAEDMFESVDGVNHAVEPINWRTDEEYDDDNASIMTIYDDDGQNIVDQYLVQNYRGGDSVYGFMASDLCEGTVTIGKREYPVNLRISQPGEETNDYIIRQHPDNGLMYVIFFDRNALNPNSTYFVIDQDQNVRRAPEAGEFINLDDWHLKPEVGNAVVDEADTKPDMPTIPQPETTLLTESAIESVVQILKAGGNTGPITELLAPGVAELLTREKLVLTSGQRVVASLSGNTLILIPVDENGKVITDDPNVSPISYDVSTNGE